MSRVNTERLQVSVSPELYEWLRMLAAGRRSISETAREILEREWHESLLIPALEGDSEARVILETARAGDDGLPGKRDPAVQDTTALAGVTTKLEAPPAGTPEADVDATHRVQEDHLPAGPRSPVGIPRHSPEPTPWPGQSQGKRDPALPWSILCRSRQEHRIGVVCPECKGTGPR